MKRKILLIGWFFYPKVGGVESLMLSQALWLVKHNYQVTVLTSKIDDQPEKEKYQGITIIRQDFLHPNNYFPIDSLKSQFLGLLNDISPSIIHFHNSSYPFLASPAKTLAMFEVAKNNGRIIVEHAHNAQLNKPNLTRKIRKLPWDQLICVSKFVKDNWNKLGNAAKGISVVYNGINPQSFQPVKASPKLESLKKRNNANIIFFAARITRISTGRIDKQKNFLLLLRACKKLLKLGRKDFIVIAFENESLVRGKARTSVLEIKKLIQKYDLVNNIVFLPNVSPDEIKSYYKAADIVCVPSICETFGLVYIEAMASGRVAIASNTGGPTEYIQNGKNGYLVNPKDPNDLANILSRLLVDEKLRQKISTEGARTAEKYTIERMMKKITRIYDQLVKEGR